MQELSRTFGDAELRVEKYGINDRTAFREVTRHDGGVSVSTIALPKGVNQEDAQSAFDQAWLRTRVLPRPTAVDRAVRVADIFSGCGAMSLGVGEACRALGFGFEPVLAVERDRGRAASFRRNFPRAGVFTDPVENLLDGRLGAKPTRSERSLVAAIGSIDLMVGGPPCQGHSDLNNYTRRDDPRNLLYLKMVRCAEVFDPTHIIIENVPGVRHDRSSVMQRSIEELEALDYFVEVVTLRGELLGVPQRRKRTFLIASRSERLFRAAAYACEERNFCWACDDLRVGEALFDKAANMTQKNKHRVDYLFENDLHDLPNHCRPACHKEKEHSYKSAYGRMHWDLPAQTITTGYGSMGQGRFVHPREPRTITPHEAARLQFIPDFFNFASESRTALAEMIGNAVPPKMSYALALHLLR